jgi:hypothetical protein
MKVYSVVDLHGEKFASKMYLAEELALDNPPNLVADEEWEFTIRVDEVPVTSQVILNLLNYAVSDYLRCITIADSIDGHEVEICTVKNGVIIKRNKIE